VSSVRADWICSGSSLVVAELHASGSGGEGEDEPRREWW
jgi:hypothetical protein